MLQSERFLLNLGKFYRFSLVSSLPFAPWICCAAALQVFIMPRVLLDVAEYEASEILAYR